jgi:hypothetical protein
MDGRPELFEFEVVFNRRPNHYDTYVCVARDFNEARYKFKCDFDDPNSPPTIVSITKRGKVRDRY